MPKVPRSNPLARTIFLKALGWPRGAFSFFFLATWSGLAASAIIGARGDLAHAFSFFSILFYTTLYFFP
jgi:hypothetical protein